jgi:adenosylhomocysteine nucleosidase
VSLARVGIVVALPSESRSLSRQAVRIGEQRALGDQALLAASGVGEQRAAHAAQQLVDAGVRGLVSWGCAAGLSAEVPAGALCLPEFIVTADGQRWPTDSAWRHGVVEALGQRTVFNGALAHASRVLASSAAKRDLAAQAGAVVADMESAAIARVAHRYALPLLVVRSVVDPLGLTLPAVIADHVDESGHVPLVPLLRGLLRQPGDLLSLLHLATGFRSAMASLRAVATSAGCDLLLAQSLSRHRPDGQIIKPYPFTPESALD